MSEWAWNPCPISGPCSQPLNRPEVCFRGQPTAVRAEVNLTTRRIVQPFDERSGTCIPDVAVLPSIVRPRGDPMPIGADRHIAASVLPEPERPSGSVAAQHEGAVVIGEGDDLAIATGVDPELVSHERSDRQGLGRSDPHRPGGFEPNGPAERARIVIRQEAPGPFEAWFSQLAQGQESQFRAAGDGPDAQAAGPAHGQQPAGRVDGWHVEVFGCLQAADQGAILRRGCDLEQLPAGRIEEQAGRREQVREAELRIAQEELAGAGMPESHGASRLTPGVDDFSGGVEGHPESTSRVRELVDLLAVGPRHTVTPSRLADASSDPSGFQAMDSAAPWWGH